MLTVIKNTFCLLAASAIFCALPAAAQWQWLDKDGRKVFSDRSPPPEIAEKNILQRPTQGRLMTPVPETGAATNPLNPNSALKASSNETELLAKKKQAENLAAAARKLDDEKNIKAKKDNCERAKTNLATLQSGTRIATVNAKGEREFMDEARLLQESKRVQESIDGNC